MYSAFEIVLGGFWREAMAALEPCSGAYKN